MNVQPAFLKVFVISFCLLLFFLPANAQQKDSLYNDSVTQSFVDTNSFVEKVRRVAGDAINDSKKDFREDLYATRQRELLEAKKKKLLKQGIL